MIYFKKEPPAQVKIVYKNAVLLDFDSLQLSHALGCLLAYYFVFDIPFDVKTEKSIEFYQEVLGIKEAVHYETVRNRQYISFLTQLHE